MTMETGKTNSPFKSIEDWLGILRRFKENLAKRLWAIPTISEPEKEAVFKEYLLDLDGFEKELSAFHEEATAHRQTAQDENDLLRSLLGVPEDELRAKTLALSHDVQALQRRLEEAREEANNATSQFAQAQSENETLRKRIRAIEQKSRNQHLEHIKVRQDDIRYFSDAHESLKNQLQDLLGRLAGLRELFTQTNKKLVVEKQEEIALLQQKILQEMEKTLRQKQELSWVEEEMFAKGVAQRVRTALVSAQGQLFLTLERLGLFDPETKSEATWKARLKLLVEGGDELRANFHGIQAQFQEVTSTLDDFLHLTGRRKIAREAVDVEAIVNEVMAQVYTHRQPALSIEFHPDDPLPSVVGDRELLRFSLQALIVNALEALPGNAGKINITLRNRADRGYVEFVIEDSGEGIAPYLQPKLFQPFFTTKPGRQGLSLSRARRYIELHGGHLLMLRSNTNGTLFQVRLPIKPDTAMVEPDLAGPARDSYRTGEAS